MAYAVVTGGGSGLGQAVAIELSKRGINVIITGRRHEQLVETQRLGAKGLIHAVCGDVTLAADRQKIIAALPANGHVKYLVNNAVIAGPHKSLLSVTEKEICETFQINVEAPLLLTQALLPFLKGQKASGGARIIDISSQLAHNPLPELGLYCQSKSALLMQQRVLAVELKSVDDGSIHINSVDPGIFESDLQSGMRKSDSAALRGMGAGMQPYLQTAATVAQFIAYVLLETTTEEFANETWWSIKEEKHAAKWKKN